MTTLFTHQFPAEMESPQRLVVLLHGYGADGADLIGLAPFWQDDKTLFLAPDAPTLHEGGMGRQWFSLSAELALPVIAALLEETAPVLDDYLNEQLATYQLTNKEIILGGFSQGAMLALHVGLRRKNLAGIMSFSGILAQEVPATTTRPPVFLTHGEEDPLIPFQCLLHADHHLQKANIKTTVLPCPNLAHAIDQRAISAATHFINNVT